MSVAAAAILSLSDAFLLQRGKNYFTGGFLAIDYLSGWGERAAFLLLSVLADFAGVGILAAFIILILSRLRVRSSATVVAALLGGVGPFLVADVIAYQLATYFGDFMDVQLSLELAGGNVSELFAVASSHLLGTALLITAASVAALGLVWLTVRYSRDDVPIAVRSRYLVVPALTFGIAAIAVTVANAASASLANGLDRKPTGKLLALVTEFATDFDRDGYGIGGRLADPDPFDSAIFPYAVDVPGNGVDEDGVGGDMPIGFSSSESLICADGWKRRPDVVLIVLESFRADLLGTTYEGRPITPVLNELARRGASTARAYSHNGYTAPSRYHLLSGQLVGARDGRTLVDDFNANGYLTAYFSGQDESFSGPEYQVGFERADVWYDARKDRDRRYSTFTTAGSLAVPFGVLQERVQEFLRARANTTEPLFLYVNFHDTHFPYSHNQIETLVSPMRLERGSIGPDAREALWATYANTAANVDRAVGDLIDAVKIARAGSPAVIVTADHGESLFDEGFLGHGYALNDVQTRVPLIVAELPIVIEEPFAQRALRESIGAAMRIPANASSTPRLQAVPGREVFQYLGNLHRPRQIAFLRDEGRLVYDFVRRRVQTDAVAWREPSSLAPRDYTEFLRLIHQWEAMRQRDVHPDNGC